MGEGREEEEFEEGGQNGLPLSTDWECSHLGWKEGGGRREEGGGRREEGGGRREERGGRREGRGGRREEGGGRGRRERKGINLVCLKHELT